MKYLITGTSSGLGYSLAVKLLHLGPVVGVSRTHGKAESLLNISEYTHILYDFGDGCNDERFEEIIVDIKQAFCDDDYTIILNAASFYSGSRRLDPLRLEEIFSVNVFSVMRLIQELCQPGLRRILVVNSISGLIGQGCQHEYSATKHAIMGYVRSLIKSAKTSSYDVMCINPGGMKTELWTYSSDVNTSDFLDPCVVADLCASLLAIPQRTFIESMTILPPSDIQ
jgi:short-subunit dehydrogenase